MAAQGQPGQPGTGSRRGRAVLAVILIVIGALLVPVSIVASWTRQMLGDTDAFVATLGPLIEEPAVQAYTADKVAAVINDALNIDEILDSVVDGLSEAIQNERAKAALEALRIPVADGLRAAIANGTAQIVSSGRVEQAWYRALERSHARAVAVLESDPDSIVAVVEGGLGLQLGPLVADVRSALQERGFELASRIPDTDRVILLVPAENLPKVQVAYQLAMAVGFWLALVSIGLLVLGVAISRSPPRAALAASLAFAAGAAVVLVGLWVARTVVVVSVPAQAVPTEVVRVVYDTVSARLVDLSLAILLLGLLVAVAAWLSGPFRSSRWLRGAWDGFRADLRRRGDARGLTTGSFGEWLHNRANALRILVGAAAVVTLLVSRPLSVSVVAWTAGLAALLLLVLSLLERPAAVVIPDPGDVDA